MSLRDSVPTVEEVDAHDDDPIKEEEVREEVVPADTAERLCVCRCGEKDAPLCVGGGGFDIPCIAFPFVDAADDIFVFAVFVNDRPVAASY